MLRSSALLKGSAAAVITLLVSASTALPAMPDHKAQTEASRKAILDFARLLYVERKPQEAFGRYFADDLIQHDPLIGDGSHGDEAFLKKRREKDPEKFLPDNQYATVVDNILADGDLVAVKSHVFTNPQDPGRAFVDIWQVKDGKFVEHWDIVQPVVKNPKNDATMWCGDASTYAEALKVGDTVKQPTCGPSGPASNREKSLETVNAYRQMLAQPGRVTEAVNTYLAKDFVQHSPHIPPGRDALAAYFNDGAAKRKASGRKSLVARVIADGDFVLYHRLVTSNDNPRGTAYADLFQVKDGKIVAHWDVVQPIPSFTVSGRSMVIGPLEPGRTRGGPENGQE